MLTIAILHYAAPPVVGGVESTIGHHARLLASAGYPVRIIAGRGEPFDPGIPLYLVPEVDSQYPEVLSVAQELRVGRVAASFKSLRDRLSGKLRSLLADVDVCIVHNALTLHKNLALTAALDELNRERVTRFVAWCHDLAWKDDLYVPELHDGYPWTLLKTPWEGVQYVVVSPYRRVDLANLLGISPANVEVISPGVDVAEFLKLELATRRLVDKLGLLSADPLILMPTRITRRKNIELGLQITAALLKDLPNATLIVTGPPGPHNPTNVAYLAKLQSLRQELDLVHRVYFLYEHGDGRAPLQVSDAMMSDLYQLADLLLFPSRYEGFGMPILEAALARLPIFAADIPPVRETVGHAGQLFDLSADPSAVAQKIVCTLAHHNEYQFRRRVKHQYTWQAKVTQELIPLLERMTGHDRKKPEAAL